jgi:hypothetical protein
MDRNLHAIAAEVARVRSLSGDALRRRWQSVFGRSPPERLTADLLRRMIAARIQEEAFGTLDRATLKRAGSDSVRIPKIRQQEYTFVRMRGYLPRTTSV